VTSAADVPPEVFRSDLRGWLDANLPTEWRAPGFWYTVSEDASLGMRREWEREKFDAGWAGIDWPPEYGGQGGTVLQRVIYEEELALAHAPASVQPQIPILYPSILLYGDEAQKRRFLRPLLRCDDMWCQGFSEPDAGSDLASLRTTAVQHEDSFVLTGQKLWTSFAHIADWCFVLARSGYDEQRSRFTLLLVDMSSPGVDVRGIRMANGRLEFAEVFFSDVRVPAANVLGGIGEGWSVINGVLKEERAAWAAQSPLFRYQLTLLGSLMQQAQRDGQRAAASPELRQAFGKVAVDVELLQLHLSEVLEATLAGHQPRDSSVTKLFSSLTHQALGYVFADVAGPTWHLDDPDPLCGDIDGGVLRELQQVFVRSLAETISGGTAQIQRNIIGERLLGLPRSVA
jgi:alkylation response protein AidB-like acyl-CoA dehydrogenase